jgi:TRAP-type mannitol/chloroaromatic compound transport system permease large subunit
MRYIPILGVVYLFFPIILKHNSFRAKVVLINGIIFHSNNKNEFLKYYDILCNVILGIYTYNKNNKVKNNIIFSVFFYILNGYLFNRKYLSDDLVDLNHVLFVQLPLSIGLKKSLLMK